MLEKAKFIQDAFKPCNDGGDDAASGAGSGGDGNPVAVAPGASGPVGASSSGAPAASDDAGGADPATAVGASGASGGNPAAVPAGSSGAGSSGGPVARGAHDDADDDYYAPVDTSNPPGGPAPAASASDDAGARVVYDVKYGKDSDSNDSGPAVPATAVGASGASGGNPAAVPAGSSGAVSATLFDPGTGADAGGATSGETSSATVGSGGDDYEFVDISYPPGGPVARVAPVAPVARGSVSGDAGASGDGSGFSDYGDGSDSSGGYDDPSGPGDAYSYESIDPGTLSYMDKEDFYKKIENIKKLLDSLIKLYNFFKLRIEDFKNNMIEIKLKELQNINIINVNRNIIFVNDNYVDDDLKTTHLLIKKYNSRTILFFNDLYLTNIYNLKKNEKREVKELYTNFFIRAYMHLNVTNYNFHNYLYQKTNINQTNPDDVMDVDGYKWNRIHSILASNEYINFFNEKMKKFLENNLFFNKTKLIEICVKNESILEHIKFDYTLNTFEEIFNKNKDCILFLTNKNNLFFYQKLGIEDKKNNNDIYKRLDNPGNLNGFIILNVYEINRNFLKSEIKNKDFPSNPGNKICKDLFKINSQCNNIDDTDSNIENLSFSNLTFNYNEQGIKYKYGDYYNDDDYNLKNTKKIKEYSNKKIVDESFMKKIFKIDIKNLYNRANTKNITYNNPMVLDIKTYNLDFKKLLEQNTIINLSLYDKMNNEQKTFEFYTDTLFNITVDYIEYKLRTLNEENNIEVYRILLLIIIYLDQEIKKGNNTEDNDIKIKRLFDIFGILDIA